MKLEKSCGAVVFTQTPTGIKYIVVKQHNGHHSFPKGHMEGEETEIQTAMREIFEETHLKPTFLGGFRTTEDYPLPTKPGTTKRVVYFLAETNSTSFVPQEGEISDVRAYSFDEAMKVFEYPSAKRILKEASSYIGNYIHNRNMLKARIEKCDAMKVIGFERDFLTKTSYKYIPLFWEEVFGKKSRGNGENDTSLESIDNAIKGNQIGEFGICIDEKSDGSFTYLIAGEYKGGEYPDGLSVRELPEGLWAKFEGVGRLPTDLQKLNTAIFSKWLPGNSLFRMSAPISVEWYDMNTAIDGKSHYEIRIPVKEIRK